MPKGKDARVSDHHSSLQKYANKDEPWFNDNVSIEFIVPNSEEDKKKFRARVYQKANGTIKPFDVTAYQYDSNLIEPTDIVTIFKAIIVFLRGGDYSDPFAGTPKKAKVLPRHSNIKPYRGTTSGSNSLNESKLDEIAMFCLGDYLSLPKLKEMKQTIRLNEAQFNRLVKETVKRVLNEANEQFFEDKGFIRYLWEEYHFVLDDFKQLTDENRMKYINIIKSMKTI